MLLRSIGSDGSDNSDSDCSLHQLIFSCLEGCQTEWKDSKCLDWIFWNKSYTKSTVEGYAMYLKNQLAYY